MLIHIYIYMAFEEKVEDIVKETKTNKMKNTKTVNDVAQEVLNNFNYFQLKIQDLEDRVKKLEWKPKASKPADENDPAFKNKRNIYLGKLNDKSIKEPKPSTLQYYNIKYDEFEKRYC